MKKYILVPCIILLFALFSHMAFAGSPSSPGVGPLNVSITGGNAGGDLGGTYPNPTVLQFNGTPLGTMSTQAASAVAITGGTINSTAIGGTTAAAIHATTLAASGAVSGTGFSTYLASPPAIGGTAPAAGHFTTLSTTGLAQMGGGTESTGTTFTIASGCGSGGTAPSSLTGGAATGSFVANATACSPVITLPTAANGWLCTLVDQTHPADTFTQTANSATTCTMTVASAVTASDVLIFHAEAY